MVPALALPRPAVSASLSTSSPSDHQKARTQSSSVVSSRHAKPTATSVQVPVPRTVTRDLSSAPKAESSRRLVDAEEVVASKFKGVSIFCRMFLFGGGSGGGGGGGSSSSVGMLFYSFFLASLFACWIITLKSVVEFTQVIVVL